MRDITRIVAAGALALAVGCSLHTDHDDPVVDRCAPRELGPIDEAGQHHQYVVASIAFPDSAAAATQLGMNLDDDPQGGVDNALGQVLSAITSASGYDLGAESQELIEAGAILHLLDVHALSVKDAEHVGVALAHAIDSDGDPFDNLDGNELFQLDEARGSGLMTGEIVDERISVDLGRAPLAVTLPGLVEPVIVWLERARIDAAFTAGGLEGTIAGAIVERDIGEKLIPLLQQGLMRIVDNDCTGMDCSPGSFGGSLLDYLDVDGDGTISLEELSESGTVASLFKPDIDLFDEDGNLAPRCDGVKDSLSFGVGFTAVPALFPTP